MYLIIQFTDQKEVKIAVTSNHFDAGYQYNLLSMEEGQQAFLFEVDEGVTPSLELDPEKFDFETLPGAKVLAVNGEAYTKHEDYDEEDLEPKCSCEPFAIYNNLCCPVHGKTETGETFGI